VNVTFRLPDQPPSAADLAERDRFDQLVRESLPAVQASAEAWRNGLVVFITLLGTAMVIKGRDTTTTLPTEWKAAVTALVGGGMALALVGLWFALAAQVGDRPLKITLAEIHSEYVSVDNFKVVMAIQAARKLDLARRTVGLALVLLLTGTTVTWWAPGNQESPAREPVVTSSTSPASPDHATLPGLPADRR